MSAAESSEVDRRRRHTSFSMPDNRCCFCLTLRSGSILVAIINVLVNVLGFSWYATSPSVQSSLSHSTSVTDLDISVVIVFILQIVADFSLIYGAVKRAPAHTLPWICANAVIMGVLLVAVSLMLFFGYVQMSLQYDEYVAILSLMGCLAGAHLFSCMVVFQFRKNLLEERQIRRQIAIMEEDLPQNYVRPSSPPPTYDEVSKVRPPHEKSPAKPGSESPPEYASLANTKSDHTPSAPSLGDVAAD